MAASPNKSISPDGKKRDGADAVSFDNATGDAGR